MKTQELYHQFEMLEQRLEGAGLDTRLSLQPEVSKMIDLMRERGVRVPSRVRRLDAVLREDVIEARFDNIPI